MVIGLIWGSGEGWHCESPGRLLIVRASSQVLPPELNRQARGSKWEGNCHFSQWLLLAG